MNPSRRNFLKSTALAGTALVRGIHGEGEGKILKSEPSPAVFEPNQWLKIEPSGRVILMALKCEMGQGVRTSLPMLIAEELEVDWETVEVKQASPGPKFNMHTSGSGSIEDSWKLLRTAGAAAREMLVLAAAQMWMVEVATCRAEKGTVFHEPTKRRVSYGELTAAAAKLPVPQNPHLKEPNQFRLLRSRIKRVDGPAIVSGKAEYGLDVHLPGMKYATVLRSPTNGGKAVSWEAGAARKLAGVLDVMPISTGIAVVAENTWTAFKARDLVKVAWDAPPHPLETTGTLMKKLETALDKNGRVTRQVGDPQPALDRAWRKFEAEYRYPFQAHAALEPLNCTAHVHDGGCELWVGTQAPNRAQAAVAKLLRIQSQDVKINVTLLGGGFGRRLAHDFILEAVEVSRATNGPVQLVWTRQDDLRHDYFQSAAIDRLTAGVDGEGNLMAWIHRNSDFYLTILGPLDPNNSETYDASPSGAYDNPYEIPNLQVWYSTTESPVRTGPWRAVTTPACVFARESFLDEIAAGLKRDPVQLRLQLLKKTDLLRLNEHYSVNRAKLRRVVELAALKAGWGNQGFSRTGTQRGLGMACNVYGATMAQVAEISVGPDHQIVVHKITCAVDCGQVVNLSGLESQIEGGIIWGLTACLRSQITFNQGQVEQSSYLDFPVLRMDETPEIEIHIIPSHDAPTGIGETPVPLVYPAVSNAVCAATGKRLRRIPLKLSE